jgi:hypothetical protein
MKPEFIILTILIILFMAMFMFSDLRWQKEREFMLKMAEIERQRLLDRIQSRDLPEYKAVTAEPPKRRDAEPTKDELIPL